MRLQHGHERYCRTFINQNVGSPLSWGCNDSRPNSDDNHYLIRRGDELALDFYMSPEFNDDIVVRPDGNVSLRLVGDVRAVDLTPPQLAEELSQATRRNYARRVSRFTRYRSAATLVDPPRGQAST
jgi:protein involved in polysaccharide export with SLBB domain